MPAKPKAGSAKRRKDSGDRRGESKLAKTQPVGTPLRITPTPPPLLRNDRSAQRRFRQLYEDAHWLGPSDAYTVATLVWCQTLIEEQAISLPRNLVTQNDSGREYVHPKVRIVFDAMREVRELTAILALGAADRARLGLQEAQAQSLLARLRGERLTDAIEAQTIDA